MFVDGESLSSLDPVFLKPAMWLIVGLGNPTREYEGTFHNVGFRVLGRLGDRLQIGMDERFAEAKISRPVSLGGQSVVLVMPQTFMNRSGVVLPRLLERFDSTIQHTVVVFDDLALPLGKIRIRQKGSAGGHNGIKSIISTVGSDEFLRVRVGIHPDHEIGDTRDFVLSDVRKTEQQLMQRAEEAAVRAIESLLALGIEKTMADFNGIDLREEGGNSPEDKPDATL